MLKNSLEVLEYNQLLNILSTYTESEIGKEYLLSLRPVTDIKEIDYRLRLLAEVRDFLNVKGRLFIGELVSLDKLLKRCELSGFYLSAEEILLIKNLINVALDIKKAILSEGKEYKRLYALAKSIPDLKELYRSLDKTISDTGRIKDSASVRLRKIREKKVYYRGYVQDKLQEILNKLGITEFQLSIRDGRYVVGISSNKKSKIKGIIHGYSHSKATSFIEPAELVEENNKIAELEAEEKEEERQILIFITREIAKKKEEIKEAQSILAKIDVLCAQAKFCDLLSCVMPEICEEDIVELKSAKNPLLAYFSLNGKGECVPVDIFLGPEKRVLIISGPNRGGKTVALKTLGLLVLMVQTGMHIPVEEGSRLRIFHNVIAEIGDEQDIYSGMSTFSAHVQHLKFIIENADTNSLVIIDEPGMGTDPIEGAALSMAILDYLIEKGVFVAISTHLNRLKLYGLSNPKVFTASVEFDPKRKVPTYKIKYGTSGLSMGFEIAEEIGIPSSILQRAKGYVTEEESKLHESIQMLDSLVNNLKKERERLVLLKEEYGRLYEELSKERRYIIRSAKKEIDSIIAETKKEALKIISSIKKDASSKQIIRRFSDLSYKSTSKLALDSEISPEKGASKVKEGQLVYHKGLKNKVTVISYDDEKKRALVSIGKIRLWTELDALEPIISEEKQVNDKKESSVSSYEGSYLPEINIVGFRVEDAIRAVDKAVDDALLKGNPGLRIIHGVGTGKLRKAIREYLKEIPQIKEIKGEDSALKGDAITIVEFK